MNDPNKILEAYIEQVLKIQQEKNKQSFNPEELNKIATDLGLSQVELQYIDSQFKDFLARGQGYSRYRNWDKAIAELQQAVLLKPLHIQALFELADALRNRWLKEGKKSDKEQALWYAERCLQSDPKNEGAFFIINQLTTLRPSRQKNLQKLFRLGAIISFSVLTLLLCYLAVQLMFPNFLNRYANQKNNLRDKTKIVERIIQENIDIPIGLVENNKLSGLSLDLESSFLKKTSVGYIYQLKGSIISTSYEIDKLDILIELVDREGKIIFQQNYSLLDELSYEIRKGDAIPLSILMQDELIKSNVQNAKITIQEVQKTLAPEKYEDAKLLNPTWEIPLSEGMNLEIRQRYQVIKPEVDVFSHEIVFEFENKGTQPIKHLQIQIEWFDVTDQLIHEETVELINLTQPMLKPRQIRSKNAVFLIDLKRSDFKLYKITVLQVG